MKIYKYIGSIVLIAMIAGFAFNGISELVRFVAGFSVLYKIISLFLFFILPFMPAVAGFTLWGLFIASIEKKEIRKSVIFLLLGIILPIIIAFISYYCLDVIHTWIIVKI